MYIKSLVIDGFKSYCQRTEINGFDPQFNAITGLNGSGKSNILDAVCFLLGISNLSQVRAANLQELVYKSGQAGIMKATVSAVFDNSDKSQSPYGYEQFDELTITRQIVVGGKNKYLINGTNATNTRVHDLFHSVQLNVNNPHFLIMQGRITKILNMKPPEILSLLEEAASTKLYEHKKEVALKTIEKKDSKLREIARVLREDINPTITKLREERSSYLEYQKIVREITHLEKFIVAYDFHCFEEAKQRAKGDVFTLEQSRNEQIETLNQLKQAKCDVEKRIVELNDKRVEFQGTVLEQLESTMSACQKTEAVAKGASNRANDALKTAKQSLKHLESQCSETENQLNAKHQAAESACGKEFQAIQLETDDAKAKLAAAERRLQTVKSGLSSGEDGVAASLAEQVRIADGEKCAAQTELRQLEMRQQHLQSEIKNQEAIVAKIFGRLSMSGTQSNEEVEQSRLTEEIQNLVQLISRAEANDKAVGNEATLHERQLIITKEANEARYQANAAAAQFPQLAFDYTDPEANFDRRRVYGPVAKLIHIKDMKFSTAIEVAAGSRLYNIVVACDRTGKLLLERGQLRRRVTMLPLNQIRGTVVPPGVLKQAQSLVGPKNVFTALSLIDFPPELNSAMEYVFGNILVCTNLDTARQVAFEPGIERKTVTLEGDVFDPQGTLSGGSRAPESNSLLCRLAHWHELEATALKAEEAVRRGDANLKAAGERAQEIAQLRESLDAARHRLGILEAELRQTDRHRLKTDLLSTKRELDQVNADLKLSKERLTNACERATQARQKVVNVASEHEREKREAEEALAQAKLRVEKATQLLREKTTVKETLRLEAEELAKELNAIKLSLQEAISSIERAKQEAERCSNEAKEATAALQQARSAVDTQRALIDETVAAVTAAEKRANQLTQAINQASCQLEKLTAQIDLQTKQSEETDSKINRLLEAHPWIADERHNFGVENGAYCFTSRDPNEARRRIQSLKDRRDRLSRTVNMRAMNMLGSAEEQYSDLVKRQEIVLADKRKIQTVIDDLDQRKREVLFKAYDKVNQEFCNIFSTLLPGSKARLLPPENQSVLDGLEIKVAFGDTWKESLGELSGGQRSLAALSLILALLLFKPAPLYILDEVDAALDLSHTQNIGQLIKHHFQHSQFLIVSLKDGMFNNANVLFKTKFQNGVSSVTRHVPMRELGNTEENRMPTEDKRRKGR